MDTQHTHTHTHVLAMDKLTVTVIPFIGDGDALTRHVAGDGDAQIAPFVRTGDSRLRIPTSLCKYRYLLSTDAHAFAQY